MACSSSCTVGSVRFVFHHIISSFAVALEKCKGTDSLQVSYVNNSKIYNQIRSCCQDGLDYWVTFAQSQFNESLQDSQCQFLRTHADSMQPQNASCMEKKNYICRMLPDTTPTSTSYQVTGTTQFDVAPLTDKNIIIAGAVGGAAALLLLGFFLMYYIVRRKLTEHRLKRAGVRRSNYYRNHAASMKEISEMERNPKSFHGHYCVTQPGRDVRTMDRKQCDVPQTTNTLQVATAS